MAHPSKGSAPTKSRFPKARPLSDEPRYVSNAETGRILKKVLKKRFPDTKFSIRSHGTAIHVTWESDTSWEDVTEITNQYRGGGFDGMIDLEYRDSTYLFPDGTVAPASSQGTEASGGIVPAYKKSKPAKAELVRFPKYIFAQKYRG